MNVVWIVIAGLIGLWVGFVAGWFLRGVLH